MLFLLFLKIRKRIDFYLKKYRLINKNDKYHKKLLFKKYKNVDSKVEINIFRHKQTKIIIYI